MIYRLYKERRLISLLVMPLLLGSWLLFACQNCFGQTDDSQAQQISSPGSHCATFLPGDSHHDSSDNGGKLSDKTCPQLMLPDSQVADYVASSLLDLPNASSPDLLYSYFYSAINSLSNSSVLNESLHARSDLYTPEKNRILLI